MLTLLKVLAAILAALAADKPRRGKGTVFGATPRARGRKGSLSYLRHL